MSDKVKDSIRGIRRELQGKPIAVKILLIILALMLLVGIVALQGLAVAWCVNLLVGSKMTVVQGVALSLLVALLRGSK